MNPACQFLPGNGHAPERRDDRIEPREGGAMILVTMKDDKVLHFSGNLGLSHVEFVKRSTGTLPDGAWVGTVHKTPEGILAFSSKIVR